MTPKVHVMRVWDFASRTYRKEGVQWMQMSLDRGRFKDRISNQQDVLNQVLKADHRDKIFRERFQES
jgi:hypothetical protein